MDNLEVILDSVRDTVGDLDGHPLVRLAEVHGPGFLTGSAQAALECAVEAGMNGNGRQFEADLLETIGFLVMAIHIKRSMDGSEIVDGPPTELPPGVSISLADLVSDVMLEHTDAYMTKQPTVLYVNSFGKPAVL